MIQLGMTSGTSLTTMWWSPLSGAIQDASSKDWTSRMLKQATMALISMCMIGNKESWFRRLTLVWRVSCLWKLDSSMIQKQQKVLWVLPCLPTCSDSTKHLKVHIGYYPISSRVNIPNFRRLGCWKGYWHSTKEGRWLDSSRNARYMMT